MYQLTSKRNTGATDFNGLSFREKIQYSLIGLALAGGLAFVGRKVIKNAIAGNEQSKTFDEDSPATFAKQIKMAFENDGWWGTDKVALRNALRSVPSKAVFRKVISSYKKLYNDNLLSDMQAELKSTEYTEMLSIIATKPENGSAGAGSRVTEDDLREWAKRLKAAFDIDYAGMPGTDEEAVKAVFIEIPTQEVFNKVAAAYKSLYGESLSDDLTHELEFWEYSPMLQIISSKPKN